MALTVLVPTRGRPDAAVACQAAFEATRGDPATRLVFVVDDDDPQLASYLAPREDHHLTVIRPPHATGTGMTAALNAGVRQTLLDWPHEGFLGFIGDDHRFRTPNWDVEFIKELSKPGIGFVYGYDKFWHEGQIPTQVFMRAEICRRLGWMALPGTKHLYLDNTWMLLGTESGSIKWRRDIIVEHMHPAVGKAEWDEGYKRVNDQSVYSHDRQVYETWISSGRAEKSVEKVREALRV
jgi:hypothetical protein